MRHLIFMFLLASCTDDADKTSEPDFQPDVTESDATEPDVTEPDSTCVDLHTLDVCEHGRCTPTPCRGDEVCTQGACGPWQLAELYADFDLNLAPEPPHTAHIQMRPGGFPRQFARARFDFGNGMAGWGESLRHTFDPGIWPVTLTVHLEDRTLTRTRLAVIPPLENHNPLSLTINQIPDYLNGSQQAPLTDGTHISFHHLLPHDNFSIDIALLEDPENPILSETLRLTASHPTDTLDLTHLIDQTQAPLIRLDITPQNALPQGPIILELTAKTQDQQTHLRSLSFVSVELGERHPFKQPLTWLIRHDLDLFTVQRHAIDTQRYSLTTTQTPNGKSDFIEELHLIGAQGPDPVLNAVFLERIKDDINTEIYRYFGMAPDGTAFDQIAFQVVWNQDPGAPNAEDFTPDGNFSMMRLGGTFNGFMGWSVYHPYHNQRADNATPERGVATAGILSALTSSAPTAPFFQALNIDSGHPVGTHPLDATVLAEDFDPYAAHPEATLVRYHALHDFSQDIAYALASVIAHEMGHAMGLVPNGIPPYGLFGDATEVSFMGPRTNAHHADFPRLELMQAGGDSMSLIQELVRIIEAPAMNLSSLARLLALETHLAPLDRAYLQGRLTWKAEP